MRVLVAEDERQLADLVAEGLRGRGFAVDVVYDGAEAERRLALNDYDLVVLDRDLPRTPGDVVCARLAQQSPRPGVLMLTAFAEVEDRIEGLRLGADDYLPKPFAFPELVARLEALARRGRHAQPAILRRGELELDTARLTARRGDDDAIELTAKEAAVLRVLMAADGAPVSAEALLQRAWDENADPFTGAVKVTVHRLRRKLGEPAVIETVREAGYRVAA
jgi:DNA-binding response OmpR family regulator